MKTYTPLQYLQIDISNHYGNDKMQFEDRIQWVLYNEKELESFVDTAEDQYRFTAAVLAYRQAQAGEPVHYLVGMDAAASGIAILGAVAGCKTTARNTGIIGNRRKDIYGICTDVMSALLGSDVNVPRKEVKAALMPQYYGSKAAPKRVFGKGTEEHQAFLEAAETVAPGASALKERLLMAWQPFALKHSWAMPDGFLVVKPVLQTMETTLRFDELGDTRIKMLYEDNVGTETGLSLVADVTHALDSCILREITRRCNFNREQLAEVSDLLFERIRIGHGDLYEDCPPVNEALWKGTGFLSLVGMECINEISVGDFGIDYCKALYTLIEKTLVKPSFEILALHDEYLCHPNYMNHVRQTMIDVLAELADSDTISHILSQITGSDVKIEPIDCKLGDLIRDSEYIIG
jgi:hypothetical protein